MVELADIDADVGGLLPLQQENGAILKRQLGAIEAGEDIESNQIADDAFVVFDEIGGSSARPRCASAPPR